MKKYLYAVLLFSGLSCADSSTANLPIDAINMYYVSQIDSLEKNFSLFLETVKLEKPEIEIQQAFKNCRVHWKHIEPLTEYYFANASEFINGPALPEEEDNDSKIIEPTGFQVIEEYIFPYYDKAQKEMLIQEIRVLESAVIRLRELNKSNLLTDANIFEAARLELLRIISLGISGFDSPIANNSIPEAKFALIGVQKILTAYSVREDSEGLNKKFIPVFNFLDSHNNFEDFDRATFIRDFILPLSKEIFGYQQRLNIPNNKWLTAFNLSFDNIADATNYNASFFSPAYTQNLKPKKQLVDLGRMLFFDPILSGNNARACASCHDPQKAFTDGNTKSKAFAFNGAVFRNAPTLINSGFQRAQFADSRVSFLEDQITDVMHNPQEMNGDIQKAILKIASSTEYRSLFIDAFDDADSNHVISGKNIQIALASYLRSLKSFNSRFDLFMRGEQSSLNEGEIKGLNLFMGKAKCGTCHFMPLFNGSVPPMYTETESEVLGVPARSDTANALADSDEGKINVSKKDVQKNMFKTPTVRNAALTAPYMHNGVYATLEEVIDFYNRGGGAGIGIELENQTLPPDPLKLSSDEKKQIISFIDALTDTTDLGLRPSRLPKVGDSMLDKRKIGGVY